MNGKGDSPRNCFSKQFKDRYDDINWRNKNKTLKKKKISNGVVKQQLIILKKKIFFSQNLMILLTTSKTFLFH